MLFPLSRLLSAWQTSIHLSWLRSSYFLDCMRHHSSHQVILLILYCDLKSFSAFFLLQESPKGVWVVQRDLLLCGWGGLSYVTHVYMSRKERYPLDGDVLVTNKLMGYVSSHILLVSSGRNSIPAQVKWGFLWVDVGWVKGLQNWGTASGI